MDEDEDAEEKLPLLDVAATVTLTDKDGKTTDNNRTRQKFCCPFRQSKTSVCPL